MCIHAHIDVYLYEYVMHAHACVQEYVHELRKYVCIYVTYIHTCMGGLMYICMYM